MTATVINCCRSVLVDSCNISDNIDSHDSSDTTQEQTSLHNFATVCITLHSVKKLDIRAGFVVITFFLIQFFINGQKKEKFFCKFKNSKTHILFWKN